MRCALRSSFLRAVVTLGGVGVFASALGGCTASKGTPVGARATLHGAALSRPYTRAAAPRHVPFAPRPARAHGHDGLRGSREQVVADARGLVGKKAVVLDGRRHPDDCTGLIRAVYGRAGVDLLSEARRKDNAVTAIWRHAQRHGRVYEGGRPLPGDLVFFRETYDLNRDGRRNDGLTHIGLVDTVRPDGTVLIIHRVARGVVRYRMNLEHPRARLHPKSGEVINDALRAPGATGPARLTSELFAGYATLFDVNGPERLAARSR